MIESLYWIVSFIPLIASFFYARFEYDHTKQKWIERINLTLILLIGISLVILKKFDESILLHHDEVLISLVYCICFYFIHYISPVSGKLKHQKTYELIGLGGTLGIYLIDELWTLPFFWTLHLLPSFYELTNGQILNWRRWRIFGLMQILSLISLTLGVILLTLWGYRYEDLQILSLVEHHPLLVIPGTLFLLAAFVRQGVFPFHIWARDYINHSSMQVALSFLTSFTGFYLIYRIALPIMHYNIHDIFPFISILTIFSSLYISALNLIENNLKSIIIILILSQSTLITCGFELHEKIADFGSLYQWVAIMLSATGFGLIMAMILERTGLTDIKRCYGYCEKAPRLAGFAIVMCFAFIGVPGAMAFVGEDLLFHSIIEHYPLIGTGVIITTTLNALVGYKTYVFLFNGELDVHTICPEIQKKETFVVSLIVLLTFILGLFPNLVFG